MTDDDVLHRRHLIHQLRERFNSMRMTVGVLGMEDFAEQAAQWLGFVADAADDCSQLVSMLADRSDKGDVTQQYDPLAGAAT